MTREDVTRLRRSLAMAPSLPASEARRLLEVADQLLERDERRAVLLADLGPVWAEVERLVGELARS